MLPLLTLVPVFASFVLGLVYMVSGEGSRAVKVLMCAVFISAAYLQFATRYTLVGFLVQASLALVLAIWRKVEATA